MSVKNDAQIIKGVCKGFYGGELRAIIKERGQIVCVRGKTPQTFLIYS